MIEGYDFQSSEYQFSLTQQVAGYGIPNPYAADVLEGQLVSWSGMKALRLAVGAYEPEHIGLPIPLSEGLASAGSQAVIRVVAGDLQALTALNESFEGGGTNPATVILRSVALFAVDSGNDVADLVLVYDDEKTSMAGQYAWSKWSGWVIGCWIKYGTGPNAAGTDADKPLITFIDPGGEYFYRAGQVATTDWGTPIPYFWQTGSISGGSPEAIKNCHGASLIAQVNGTAAFKMTIIPGQYIPPNLKPLPNSTFGTTPQTLAFNPTISPTDGEATNSLLQYTNDGQTQGQQPVQAASFVVQVSEDGTSAAGLEVRSFGIAVIQRSR